jgi:hypothetical protein
VRGRRLAALAAIAVLAGAPALSGCASLGIGGSPAASSLTPAKALYLAEAAFSGASTALEAAVDSGRLKGSSAAKARKAYGIAHDALLAARAAEKAGDARTLSDKTAAAISAIATVQELAATGGGFGVAAY